MGKHFYTTDPGEVTRAIVRDGRILEGVACCVLPNTPNPSPSVIPLYRLYNPSNDDHLYTTDQGERDRLVNVEHTYIDEGVACQVLVPTQPPPSSPFLLNNLYRVYNPQTGEHFYTAKAGEFQAVTVPNGPFVPDVEGNPLSYQCYVWDLDQTSVPQGAIPFYRLVTP